MRVKMDHLNSEGLKGEHSVECALPINIKIEFTKRNGELLITKVIIPCGEDASEGFCDISLALSDLGSNKGDIIRNNPLVMKLINDKLNENK